MELVVRQPDPGGRRERYVIDDDAWLRAWQPTPAHTPRSRLPHSGASQIFGTDTTAGTRLGTMGQFFARLSEQMSGSALTETAVYDALTVLAALVHADRPLTLGILATALDWPRRPRHRRPGRDPTTTSPRRSPRPEVHRAPDVHPHHETGPPQPGATRSTRPVSRANNASMPVSGRGR